MITYHSFVFNVIHDVINVDTLYHTTVPKYHTISVTLKDEDVKQADAVSVAFYKACIEYKKLLLEEQMYHK